MFLNACGKENYYSWWPTIMIGLGYYVSIFRFMDGHG
jgi:hypothetical protein